MAALMLGLYLVGGVTAYGLGYGMHNPARSAYLRAARELRRATRAYHWAQWRFERACIRQGRPGTGVLSEKLFAFLVPQPDLLRPTQGDSANAPLENISDQDPTWSRDLAVAKAEAQADELREAAKHRLAAALAEPARTSGIFEGPLIKQSPSPDEVLGVAG